MKRFSIQIIVCFLFAGALFGQGKAHPGKTAEDRRRLRDAEQLVNRAVRRFGETLDFNDIYREMFVRNAEVRKNRIAQIFKGSVDKKVFSKLGPVVLERAFVNAHNVFALAFVCSFSEAKSIDALEEEMVRQTSPRQQEIYRRLNEGGVHIIKTETEFLELLSMGDFLAARLRSRVSGEFRRKMQNQTTVETSRIISAAPQDEISAGYGDSYEVSVSVGGQWLPLVFTVVEEAGAMRILSVTIDAD